MKSKQFTLTYSGGDYVEKLYGITLNKIIPNPCPSPNDELNVIYQSNPTLYYNNNEVGKIYFYANTIGTKYFENVIVELFESPCFEANTFVTGQMFHNNIGFLFKKDKILTFNSISTGGTFLNKNITVTIQADETLIRHVTIVINDSDCKCNN